MTNLAEPQKRSVETVGAKTGCPYCNGENKAILDAPDFRLSVLNENLICDFKNTGGWINPFINYCPMCGERLSEEKE